MTQNLWIFCLQKMFDLAWQDDDIDLVEMEMMKS